MMITMGQPIIADEEIEAAVAVLKSGRLVKGPQATQLEESFAASVGARYAICTMNGTIALHMAYLAHGIGRGDYVITTPWSFIATANMILACGAHPLFVDIDPKTYLVDLNQVRGAFIRNARRAHPKRIKAIAPVHLYGQPVNLDELQRLADEFGVSIIEDACQAHGAAWRGRQVGSEHTACFSFFPSKNMHAGGEGGMITTNDSRLAERLRALRMHGSAIQYQHTDFGYNYRMPEIAAAIANVQLGRLPAMNQRRQLNAQFLTASLAGLPGITCPAPRAEVSHVYHQYTIRIQCAPLYGETPCPLSRNELRDALRKEGIQTAVHYPTPIHQTPYYQTLKTRWGRFPEAERAAQEVLSLPVHPSLRSQELHTVAQTVKEIVARS